MIITTDMIKSTIKRRGKEKLLGVPHFVPKFLQNFKCSSYLIPGLLTQPVVSKPK
jgi:hypothetical protein